MDNELRNLTYIVFLSPFVTRVESSAVWHEYKFQNNILFFWVFQVVFFWPYCTVEFES